MLFRSLAAAMQREMGDGGGYLSALHADVSGRMTKALQGKPRFQRWGKHYLRALVRAHEVQICTNFMDTGLQHYAGQLFAHLRDVGDKVFLELPPPTASAPPPQRASAGSFGRAAAAAPAPRASAPSMQTYYAGSGGG